MIFKNHMAAAITRGKSFSAWRKKAPSILALALSFSGSAWAQDTAPAVGEVSVVSEQTLRGLDLWSTPGRETGLSNDLWRGATPAAAREVLSKVAFSPLSFATAHFARRLFATGANAPDGGGDDLQLAGLRVLALEGLGEPDSALRVLDHTSHVLENPLLSQAKAESLLALGRTQDACAVDRDTQDRRDTLYWLKLRAACYVVAGEKNAASVTLDLWRSQGGKDAPFERMVSAFEGRPAPKKSPPVKAWLKDGASFAVSKAMGLDLSAGLLGARASILSGLTADASQPIALRKLAAYRALRLSLATPDQVRAIYLADAPPPAAAAPAAPGAAAVTPPPPPPPVDGAALAKDSSPETEIQLFTLAADASDFNLRQQWVRALLKRARTGGEFVAIAKLTKPLLTSLTEAGAPVSDPILIASALAAEGDAAAAAKIRASAPGLGSPSDVAVLDAAITLQTGEGQTAAADRLLDVAATADAKARPQLYGAVLWLAALDAPLSSTAKAKLSSLDAGPEKITAGRILVVAEAQHAKARGAVALEALSAAIAENGALTPGDLALVIAWLNNAGFKSDAKALALEALFGLQSH